MTWGKKNHKAIKKKTISQFSNTYLLQCPTYNKNSIRCEKPGKYRSSEKKSIKTDPEITQMLTLVEFYKYSKIFYSWT